MGFKEVRMHVRKKEETDGERIKQFFDGMGLDVSLVPQKEYLTIDCEMVSFENYEEIAMEMSGKLGLSVLVGLVFDSDVAVLQGYINGEKEYEEVKSFEENQEMDRESFLKEFFPDCDLKAFSDILDCTDRTFAEEYLFELGDVVGISFFDE